MARSIRAFLKAMEAALTASPVIGPVTNWSISSLGIFGNAADFAAMAAFFNVVLLGINGPVGHVMPRTQNSGQALPRQYWMPHPEYK
jgi:hypothetical protein